MDAILILVLLALGLVYAPRFPRVTFHYLAEHPRPWTVRAGGPVMPHFGVTPRKQAELDARMEACGLREADLEERFIRGRGPGGQKVNQSASCVYLRHKPTDIEVKTHQARSQALNRFYARRRLCELLEARTLGDQSPEALEREKTRKQKARRRRRRAAKQ